MNRKCKVEFDYAGYSFDCLVNEDRKAQFISAVGVPRYVYSVVLTIDDKYTFETYFYQEKSSNTEDFYSTAYMIRRGPRGDYYKGYVGQHSRTDKVEKLFARFVRHIAKCVENTR